MMRIDLNCDLGEGFGPWSMGDDAALLDIVSSANVACGFHAGDPDVMLRTVRAAKAKGVALGAHPSFHDLQGFGRRRIQLSAGEIEALVAYQIGALQAVASLASHRVSYVKPHGALSNMACEDERVAAAIARAVRSVDPGLVLLVLPHTAMQRAGQAEALPLAHEVYADRGYAADGTLLPRGQAGAVLTDPATIAERIAAMLAAAAILTATGARLPTRIDSICVHGDTPEAVAIAKAVRQAVTKAGYALAPFAQ